jgi:DNA-binding NtrC family response regulator
MEKGTVLIIDDHKFVLEALNQILEKEFTKVISSSNPNRIPEIIRNHKVDLVLLDMNFSAGLNTGNEGLYWLKTIHETKPGIVVILMTAYGDVKLAVEGMKRGATDFILKPWNNEKLIASLQTGLKLKRSNEHVEDLERRQHNVQESINRSYDPLLGVSAAFMELRQLINKVAQTDANILLLGENGTGKELIAREIHKQSKRSGEVMVNVDMGSIPETLFESELFGHKKGSFTDAHRDHIGRFELASKGTLFLDEIGNLSYGMQGKILSALQNRMVTPLGGEKPVELDIRLICATNKDLKMMIAQDTFRDDLFFRINTIEIRVPALRERQKDILPLAEYFLDYFSKKYEKPFIRLSKGAISKLENYNWPGNIRELKHTIEKSVILIENNIIHSDDILLENSQQECEDTKATHTLEEIEKRAILQALKSNKGNVREAAKELGVARQTLYNKMNKFNL